MTSEQLYELIDDYRKGVKRTGKIMEIMYNAAPNNGTKITNMNQPYCITLGETGEQKKYLKPVVQEILDELPANAKEMFMCLLDVENIKDTINLMYVNDVIKDIKQQIKDPVQRRGLEFKIKEVLYNNQYN